MKIASLTIISAAMTALAAQAELPAPPQEPVTYETAPAACAVEEFTIYFERGVTQLGDQAEAVLDAVAADSAQCEYFGLKSPAMQMRPVRKTSISVFPRTVPKLSWLLWKPAGFLLSRLVSCRKARPAPMRPMAWSSR